MYGTHCKHCSLIPPLVSNNNLALLRCGYMCAGTVVHILRHLGRMSNNNKRCQLIIHCMFSNSGRIDLVYDDVRYVVYIWEFLCLDYSFDVLILWSRKLGLYRCICCICPSGFTSKFFVIIFYYYYIIFIYILVYHLCSIPPVSRSYHIIPCMFPAWYHLLSLCLLMYACAHNTIFNTCSFDSDLSIHVCLSLHATWHSLHHSLGSFWLPWILMSRS